MEIFDDLDAEEIRLESILDGLDQASWLRESGAPGWTMADVVLHLAQSEEAVVASASAAAGAASARFDRGNEELDDTMDRLMRAERADPDTVFERWRKARREALETLRAADPDRALAWAAAPLKPKALATTRIAEHWAHGLDITRPLGIPFADTDRLRHVAWLAHRSLPYAFSLEGEPAQEVFCDLLGPSGDRWTYGSEDAPSSISGSAGAFCRVGARRVAPDASGLETAGPFGARALSLLRNYAA